MFGKTKKELESLKQRLTELEEKVYCRDNLKDLFVLRATNFPCDKCEIETKYCKKLIFADRTICVAPKDKVNKFPKKEKK